MQKGKLIVVSAPSGCGKGTILAEVLKDERFYYSVSATTRKPREGEVDGVHYRFLEREAFERLIAGGHFLEHAEFCENLYGTLTAPIEAHLAMGQHVILEIEVQGAAQIRQLRPDAVFVFIAPPSLETLRERLTGRGTEAPDVIAKRIAQAEKELALIPQYDYCIVNDKLEEAIADFRAVVRSIELKTEQ